MKKIEKNILIAYLPSRADLSIAIKKKWYRIPVSSKNVPRIVKNKSIEYIAFYHPQSFKEDAFLVRYYGKVTKITKARRKSLFRSEALNEKSENLYYKIQFENLYSLPQSIRSLRKRRILFITTTMERFRNAKEINDLFLESPLEEKFWNEFKKIGLSAERQFYITINKHNFILDFALFCKNRNLAIECDGDSYHLAKEKVIDDKRRDNLLESKGWNVLRYTSGDINENFNDSINQVRETINYYGGLQDNEDPTKSKYFIEKDNQPNLFDFNDDID